MRSIDKSIKEKKEEVSIVRKMLDAENHAGATQNIRYCLQVINALISFVTDVKLGKISGK